MEIDNPANMPAPQEIDFIEEPMVAATIIVPKAFVGVVMDLARERRGQFDKMEHPTPERIILHYKLPLNEILMDLFDQLKSRTRGYALSTMNSPATRRARWSSSTFC